jgi:hypothetical protein
MPRLSKRKRQLSTIRGEESEEEEQPAVASQKPVATGHTKKKKTEEKEEVEACWVQCDKCAKWRALPKETDLKRLPDIWTCNLFETLTCDTPEESFEKETKQVDTDVKLRYFFRIWLKKLRCSDRAEAKLAPSTLTRGRRRQMDVEWIRCCNPQCGKWRSTLRGMDAGEALKRLKKKKWAQKTVWYCAMNTWDETLASCAVNIMNSIG